VVDQNGYAVAGAVVQFRLDGEGALAVDRVTSDHIGLARLPWFQISPTPGTAMLTATDSTSGASLAFELIGLAETMAIDLVDPAPEPIVAVGVPLSLPKVQVTTRSGPAAAARVRYLIEVGEGAFADGTSEVEVLTDASGVSAPVTFTPTGRGSVVVKMIAVGYSSQPIRLYTAALVPPVAFACLDACVPFDFAMSVQDYVDLGVRVVDAVGPVSNYPVALTFGEAIGTVWTTRVWGDGSAEYVEMLSGHSAPTYGDGSLWVSWVVPYEPRSYAITLGGPLMTEPWTFTATRE
jgi:hypothetical protein